MIQEGYAIWNTFVERERAAARLTNLVALGKDALPLLALELLHVECSRLRNDVLQEEVLRLLLYCGVRGPRRTDFFKHRAGGGRQSSRHKKEGR
jgi:hypothetical protein